MSEQTSGPLDHQSAAGTNCATECAVRAPESSARGPAADPIADLCDRLRDLTAPEYIDGRPTACSHDMLLLEAADTLMRLTQALAESQSERDGYECGSRAASGAMRRERQRAERARQRAVSGNGGNGMTIDLAALEALHE